MRVDVRLTEWEERGPAAAGPGAELRGLSFGDDTETIALARALDTAGVVTVTELRDGLHVRTGSLVGRVSLGPLDITIVPKLAWDRWLHLFGYALRLRDVTRSSEIAAALRPSSLHDLIVLELVRAARYLITRGLHREYERQRRPLAVPRGRIDFARLANGGLRDARIPSRFTRREQDTLLNRALHAGLHVAAGIASDRALRADARRLAQELAAAVTPVPLTAQLLREATDALDRRTARYAPVLQLIELLLSSSAVALEDPASGRTLVIPGFALDMNALWQRLLSRVLTEWLPGVTVREEVSLRDIFRRDPDFSPRPSRVPLPRPDFALGLPGQPATYLDAKYRDLWLRTLPREMLYQLALYAAAQGSGVTAMLYPTEAPEASEERLQLCDPATGGSRVAVGLRPIRLSVLEQLVVAAPSVSRDEGRARLARYALGLSAAQ